MSYNLVGLNVYNGARENVGEIKDIVIARDMLDGYILSVGGFLGVVQRYVAVKPNAVTITYDPAKGKWLASINATKEQLKGGSGIYANIKGLRKITIAFVIFAIRRLTQARNDSLRGSQTDGRRRDEPSPALLMR